MTPNLDWKTREFPLPKNAVAVTLHYEEIPKLVKIMWAEERKEKVLKEEPANTA